MIFSCFISFNFFAQAKYNIDYYGIVSTDIDANMSKMTSDLYYTQLSEIANYKVNDKREEAFLTAQPEINLSDSGTIAFYSVIQKQEKTKTDKSPLWVSTLTIVDSKSTKTESKEYDSFYKILMEPKAVLQDTILTLITKKQSNSDTIQTDISAIETSLANIPQDFPLQKTPGLETTKSEISTEFLAGDWSGEHNVDKIIILRGGRGFVTFSNGATMSVDVKAKKSNENTYITVTEKGRPNASYFQELNRQIALRAAVNAAPIYWEFLLIDNNTLSGVKNTLMEINGEVQTGQIEANWSRKS